MVTIFVMFLVTGSFTLMFVVCTVRAHFKILRDLQLRFVSRTMHNVVSQKFSDILNVYFNERKEANYNGVNQTGGRNAELASSYFS